MKLPNINLSAKSIKDVPFLKNIKFRLNWGVWLYLFIILLALGWVLWGEWTKLKMINADASNLNDKIVRVNMQQHQEIERNLESNQRFVPEKVPGTEVFASPPDNIDLSR